MTKHRNILAATCVMATVVFAQQTERKFTARELFYTPVAPKTTPAPPPPNQEKTVRPVPMAKTTPAPKRTEQVVATNRTRTEQPTRPIQMEGGGVLQTASNVERGPLGLRYSVLKLTGEDRYSEVDVDTVFRAGDKIRIAVESNDDGYLYIVQRGSSKTWNLLFPNSETLDGDNHIRKNRKYEIPSEARFSFDGTPGDEKIFVVLSRQPEPDLEKLIYDLSSGAATKKVTPTPASTEQPEKGSAKMLLASAQLNDSTLMNVKNRLISRDLVFEKVSSKRPGTETEEKAYYIATPSGSSSARVVAEVSLKHQ